MTRYKRTEVPPIPQAVRIERNGTVYEGTYTVNGAMVTVTSLILGSKSAPLGAGSPETTAKIILTDLLFAGDERNRG
jgi:hypothetical protein